MPVVVLSIVVFDVVLGDVGIDLDLGLMMGVGEEAVWDSFHWDAALDLYSLRSA